MNCNITNAHEQFEIVQRFAHHSRKPTDGKVKQNVTALHIIQSFKGHETSPEKAHQLARELIKAKYSPHAQAVIATHADTDNIRNLRNYSDDLCRKHGLSVIENPGEGYSVKYKEWLERKQRNSWKEQYRNDIDHAILTNDDWGGFVRSLRDKGYKVNDSPSRKYTTMQMEGFRPVRFDNLGKNHYSKERILQRIADPKKFDVPKIAKWFPKNSCDNSSKGVDIGSPSESDVGTVDLIMFLRFKRLEYTIAENLLALDYIKALENICRLIIRKAIRRFFKLHLGLPYAPANDYTIAKNLTRLALIERYNIKTKEELDLALTREARNANSILRPIIQPMEKVSEIFNAAFSQKQKR